MSVLLLIAGLILLLAVPGLFTGAATVGLILAIAGGVLLVINLIGVALVGKQIKSTHDDIRRDFARW